MFRQLLRKREGPFPILLLSERGRRARERCTTDRGGSLIALTVLRFVSGFRHAYFESEARGLELLKEWLSPEQFAQYDAKCYFEVTGCHSGKRIPDLPWHPMNIYELDGAGRPRGWFVLWSPKGTSSQATSCCTENCAGDRRASRADSGKQIFFVFRLL